MGQVRVSPWYAVRFFLNGNLGAKMTVMQVCAIVSLLTGKCVPPTTAMTGEVRKNNYPPSHPRTP